ncbi:hypothetical protein R6Q59_030133 [Mikania micrantha]
MTGGRTNVDGKKTELEVTETGGFLFLAFIREFECVLRAQSNKWHGVGCGSRNGHVVKLDLRSHWKDFNEKWLEGSFESLEYLNLSHSSFSEGVVPHHLGNLSRLQVLDLRSIFIFDDGFGNFLAPIVDDLRWVSSLSSLRYLDLSGISIGNHTDWFHPVNMLPSLLTLNLADTGINIPSTQFVNFTSLNSIDLSDNDINSTIPIWLSNLTGLMHLNLKFNKFHGKIPDFIGTFSTLASIDLSVNSFYTSMPDLLCNLSSLFHLDLSDNIFSGPVPSNLGLLLRLEYLNLRYNHLSGNIPSNFGLLLRLEYLYLRYNQLSGNIPMVSNLVRLDLSSNKFSGPIPSYLGLLSRLEDMYLYDNQLSGNIPMSFGQLSKLKNLDLSRNSFVGVLSETHFTNLKNLIYLDLSSNWFALNFSSRWIPLFQLQVFRASSCSNIGPYFPNWLHTQTHLQQLDLSNSSIRGTLPEWFDSILSHILHLDLSNNQIGGKMPLFHFDTSVLTTLKMNSNKFEGTLAAFPSNVNHLDLSNNLLSGELPQTGETMNLTLEVVNLSKNRFTGNIPVDLCRASYIQVLDLSQNKLFGRLPECLGNLSGLIAMDLSNNTIIGVVPSSLGSFTQLTTLHLHNNRLEGKLPLSLQNLTNLVTMDIGYNFLVGDIPFWSGERLLNLRILNLQSNKFTGKIPLQFCQLNAIQHLNLAQNNIIGTIPPCFANLSGMITDQSSIVYRIYNYEENIQASIKGIQLVYTKTINFLTSLDLSSNNITGKIPDALMNLVGLKNLNLSRNQLKGRVPMRIGNLNQMESLDLSMNMLSGQIPQSLTTLNFLGYLNLSFNNLSGPIPIGNHLQTLVDPSVFQGNDGLCGPPLSRSCKGDNSSYDHVGKVEAQDEDEDEDFWLYIGMGAVETIDWRKLRNRLLWEVIISNIRASLPSIRLSFSKANGWSRRWFVLNEKTGKKTEQEKLEKLAKKNEKLNEIIKETLKEKEEEKERLNGIIAELEAGKEKHKAEKDATSNRMSKIENMLKTLVRK